MARHNRKTPGADTTRIMRRTIRGERERADLVGRMLRRNPGRTKRQANRPAKPMARISPCVVARAVGGRRGDGVSAVTCTAPARKRSFSTSKSLLALEVGHFCVAGVAAELDAVCQSAVLGNLFRARYWNWRCEGHSARAREQNRVWPGYGQRRKFR